MMHFEARRQDRARCIAALAVCGCLASCNGEWAAAPPVPPSPPPSVTQQGVTFTAEPYSDPDRQRTTFGRNLAEIVVFGESLERLKVTPILVSVANRRAAPLIVRYSEITFVDLKGRQIRRVPISEILPELATARWGHAPWGSFLRGMGSVAPIGRDLGQGPPIPELVWGTVLVSGIAVLGVGETVSAAHNALQTEYAPAQFPDEGTVAPGGVVGGFVYFATPGETTSGTLYTRGHEPPSTAKSSRSIDLAIPLHW